MSYKQYIGISRDHSGSMGNLTSSAMKDYNNQIQTIKDASSKHSIDTIVSVVLCGIGPGMGRIERAITNSSVNTLNSITTYPANGGSTPLFDSVKELIDLMKSVPDYNDPNVSFLIQVITDGHENASRTTGNKLGSMISELQASDRWTFTFRVPRGYARNLETMGIPAGNILEWDLSNKGMEVATQATLSAFDAYYSDRSKGVKSTRGFYSDLSKVSSSDVKRNLTNITHELNIFSVDKDDEQISKFIQRKTGNPIKKGTAFYELTKYEKAIQDYKKIIIQDLSKGGFYAGREARNMLGLPDSGSISISPGDHSHYKIFVQSTSLNRKLKRGTSIIQWNNAV